MEYLIGFGIVVLGVMVSDALIYASKALIRKMKDRDLGKLDLPKQLFDRLEPVNPIADEITQPMVKKRSNAELNAIRADFERLKKKDVSRGTQS